MTLKEVAQAMVANGKGILAMDESTPTCTKRFKAVGVESTEENRLAYRHTLVTTEGLGQYISGAILFDETIRQKNNGKTFPEILNSQGIMPGIKVDTGAKDFAGFPGEKVTEGLDGLRDRLKEYVALGAKFTKWRAVIAIGDGIPTQACIDGNAHALARYAALCQEQGLVPIVEPEVLMEGSHSIETCYDVTDRTLKAVFSELKKLKVDFEGMVLKPNMVLSGKEAPEQADADKVAEMTVRCLKDNVPAEVPGIAFLSGGQSDELATKHLNVMNAKFKNDVPWRLTFSYGRGLQREALKIWGSNPSEISEAQKMLARRAEENGKASEGLLS